MDGEDCYEEKHGHRQTNKGEESSEQDGKAADELGQDGKPCHEVRRRDAQRMQDGGEVFGPLGQLGEPVLHKTITNNQP